ncbi:uncharacterized protein KY384_006583 [Bacidia gigantensis]|uniref:uncharacterized protein n=1 Tax=Bacidia gigantensis TaxID=2732470 RepID=UPI001D03EE8C|nr:uncharacterized protein KY384_006583 [Bacidia gigantensis]KAG8528894.1 hypothetical protein KY384_006583 [Bacidia gigantensis]
MDQDDMVTSPRKKVKTDHSSTQDFSMTIKPTVAPSVQGKVSNAPAPSHPQGGRHSKEELCGITEFVSPDALSFSGIIKKRYTDFLVNEILPSGEVLHLQNLKAPTKDPQDRHNTGAQVTTNGSSNSGAAASRSPSAQNHTPLPVEGGNVESINPPKANAQYAAPDTNTTASSAPDISAALGVGATSEDHNVFPAAFGSPDDPLAHHFAPRPPTPPHLRKADVTAPKRERSDSVKESHEEGGRHKHKVFLRLTKDGWQELTAEQEAEFKATEEREAAELAVAKQQSGEEKDLGIPDEVQGDAKEQTDLHRPSTVAAWTSYAGSQEQLAEDESARLIGQNAIKTPESAGVQQPANGGEASTTFWGNFAGESERIKLKHEDEESLLWYFDTAATDELKSLYDRVTHSPNHPPKYYGNVQSKSTIDRATRGQVHGEIRRIFRGKLDSETEHDGHIVVKAMPRQSSFPGRRPAKESATNRDNVRPGRSNKQAWQKPKSRESGGDYLHFTLHKENKDTMESLSFLIKQLGIGTRHLQFAGTKDRRGVTVQRASVYRVALKDLIKAGKTLRSAFVGDFEYRSQGLQLGHLAGNEFTITLRDCNFHYPEEADGATILKGVHLIIGDSVRKFSKHGFINYYGLQRFGTFGKTTDNVGLAILQGDYRRAVDYILSFRPECLEAEAEDTPAKDQIAWDDRARAEGIHQFLTTGRSNDALSNLPRKFSAENAVIRHLGSKGRSKDFLGAIRGIQRNLRLMYVHAYQSLVWNHAASERWRLFGSKVVEGDLVIVEKAKEDGNNAEEVDAEGEVVVHAPEEDRATNTSDEFTQARALSREEAESGKHTIFDIVLPTPGFDVQYPANAIEGFYRTFMASERGGGLDPYNMRRSWKDASLSGSYRNLLAKPKKPVTFDIKYYTEEDEQFVETDLDKYYKAHPEEDHRSNSRRDLNNISSTKIESQEMQPPQEATTDPLHSNVAPTPTITEQPIDQPVSSQNSSPIKNSVATHSTDTDTSGGVRLDWNGHPQEDQKIAVVLKMQLSSSQYATMALRELMKTGAVIWKGDFSSGH